MKKHELIKHAYDNYPKGTKIKCLYNDEVFISSGVFQLSTNLWCNVGDLAKDFDVYDASSGKWAEIVKLKIAVKVENEKEFKALMKYYDSLGFKWNGGQTATDKDTLRAYPNVIGFEDTFQHSIENFRGWDVVTFSDFAKQHNIKLPLLTSEDGVDLFEGDKYTVVYRENELTQWLKGDDYIVLEKDNLCLSMPDVSKAFSTKQAALDWIEAQKPAETVLFEDGTVRVIVDAGGFRAVAESDDRTFKFSGEELKQIYNAWQEHLPF